MLILGEVRLVRIVAAVIAAGVLACGTPEGAPRPQLVVVIDTDLPLPSQVRDDPTISPDATIDTVRIDVIGDDREVKDVREVVALETASWPITLGVTTEGRPAVTLRVRAFRGSFAKAGTAAGVAVREPPLEASVDRLVRIPMPTEGVHHARIVLRGDCLGVPASLLDWTSCLDGARRAAPIAEDVTMDPVNVAATSVGSWSSAREVPCTTEAPVADAVCVPGGVTVLGDPTLEAFDRGLDPVPLRPAVLAELLDLSNICRVPATSSAPVRPWGPVAGGSKLDVTADGVFDMGGNLDEWTADSFALYTDPCWAEKRMPLVDPVCVIESARSNTLRGAHWASVPNSAAAAFRRPFGRASWAPSTGFRCAKGFP